VSEDTQKFRMQPASADPREALSNALLDVAIECDEMIRAIQHQHYDAAVVAASAALRASVSAHAALQRLKLRAAALRQLVRHSERAIHLSQVALADRIDGALAQMPASERRALRQLKRSLALMNDHDALEEPSCRPMVSAEDG
jgi:hypothetical protein